ncbi:MAG: alginate export family protein [Planctomycetes bacterium]|nr:alginate export family protein [Planctomycetota bacterium]MBI3844572.1 alginate export family protein [Planctomycetota bacterium]
MRVSRWLCSIAALSFGLAGTASAQQSEEQLRNEVEALKKKDEEKNRQIEELQQSIRKLQEQFAGRTDPQLHEADAAALSQEVEKYNKKMEKEVPTTDRFGEPLSDAIKSLQVSMQARTRGEYNNNLTDFNHRNDDELTFGSYRFRLGVGANVTDDLSIYLETQAAGFAGDQPPGSGNSNTSNDLDPYQGFIRWNNFLDDKDTYAKVGRQEMVYGSEMLVGDRDFGFGQSFDGVRITRDNNDYEASIWAVRVVENDVPALAASGFAHDENVNFYGAYYTAKTLVDNGKLDLYWMWLADHDSTPDPSLLRREDDRHTFGARLAGDVGDGFDYNAEFAFQVGDGTDINGRSRNINHANGLEAWLGYTFKDADWRPWIAAKYARASGDSNPNDHNDESFNPLFQDNHGRYGFADLFNFSNLQVLGLMATVDPCDKWTLGANYYYFLADEAKDATNPLGVSAGAGSSRGIGEEVDLYANYKVAKHVSLGLNYSHLFTHKYIDNQIGRISDGADRAYVNFDVHF